MATSPEESDASTSLEGPGAIEEERGSHNYKENTPMRTVSPELQRRLRNDVPVTDVIVQLGVPTARRGARRAFRCPQCEGFRTGVHRHTNLARCFRCERNFNPIDLVMAERGWSFLEAVRYLGDEVVAGVGVGLDDARNDARSPRS